jgi:hypothetical protein
MKLELKKFGELLISRPAGREDWLAAKAYTLSSLKPQEKIEVSFEGVLVLTPSWADEFLTPLLKDYPQQVILLPTDNATVIGTKETLKIS